MPPRSRLQPPCTALPQSSVDPSTAPLPKTLRERTYDNNLNRLGNKSVRALFVDVHNAVRSTANQMSGNEMGLPPSAAMVETTLGDTRVEQTGNTKSRLRPPAAMVEPTLGNTRVEQTGNKKSRLRPPAAMVGAQDNHSHHAETKKAGPEGKRGATGIPTSVQFMEAYDWQYLAVLDTIESQKRSWWPMHTQVIILPVVASIARRRQWIIRLLHHSLMDAPYSSYSYPQPRQKQFWCHVHTSPSTVHRAWWTDDWTTWAESRGIEMIQAQALETFLIARRSQVAQAMENAISVWDDPRYRDDKEAQNRAFQARMDIECPRSMLILSEEDCWSDGICVWNAMTAEERKQLGEQATIEGKRPDGFGPASLLHGLHQFEARLEDMNNSPDYYRLQVVILLPYLLQSDAWIHRLAIFRFWCPGVFIPTTTLLNDSSKYTSGDGCFTAFDPVAHAERWYDVSPLTLDGQHIQAAVPLMDHEEPWSVLVARHLIDYVPVQPLLALIIEYLGCGCPFCLPISSRPYYHFILRPQVGLKLTGYTGDEYTQLWKKAHISTEQYALMPKLMQYSYANRSSTTSTTSTETATNKDLDTVVLPLPKWTLDHPAPYDLRPASGTLHNEWLHTLSPLIVCPNIPVFLGRNPSTYTDREGAIMTSHHALLRHLIKCHWFAALDDGLPRHCFVYEPVTSPCTRQLDMFLRDKILSPSSYRSTLQVLSEFGVRPLEEWYAESNMRWYDSVSGWMNAVESACDDQDLLIVNLVSWHEERLRAIPRERRRLIRWLKSARATRKKVIVFAPFQTWAVYDLSNHVLVTSPQISEPSAAIDGIWNKIRSRHASYPQFNRLWNEAIVTSRSWVLHMHVDASRKPPIESVGGFTIGMITCRSQLLILISIVTGLPFSISSRLICNGYLSNPCLCPWCVVLNEEIVLENPDLSSSSLETKLQHQEALEQFSEWEASVFQLQDQLFTKTLPTPSTTSAAMADSIRPPSPTFVLEPPSYH